MVLETKWRATVICGAGNKNVINFGAKMQLQRVYEISRFMRVFLDSLGLSKAQWAFRNLLDLKNIIMGLWIGLNKFLRPIGFFGKMIWGQKAH